jgi:hypothetical protein
MANENWSEEIKIHKAFQKVYDVMFALEQKLTPDLRSRAFAARCKLTEAEDACRFQVRKIKRDGSTVWNVAGREKP